MTKRGSFRTSLTILLLTSSAMGAPQPLINYFQPMPIVGKLSTTVWGASTVGARDPGNGLEDHGDSGGVAPHEQTNFYWDGKIVKGEDGKYHMYASHWAYGDGFGPPVGPGGSGWQSSIAMQAISDDVMGPYVFQKDCYAANQEGNNKGHNTTALVAPTGTAPFTLSVGEIVAGQMFSASSATGPWTLLGLTKTDLNGHSGCGTLSSNFTFTVGPNNRYWATSRNGCVMDSDQVLGPYEVETDSVLPNLENNHNNDAEDEVIWYSGGYFHIVYNYWNVQRAYHLMSKDGITNWKSTGLAYQGTQTPANANSGWLRYTDGTINTWHNLERPGVYEENGHVTHFTFAVTDVDKNSSAVNTGGSKILVVPFDGVKFDCDNGDAASCAEAGGGSGGGGAGGSGGRASQGGAGGTAGGGAPATGGNSQAGGGNGPAGAGGMQPGTGGMQPGTGGMQPGTGGMQPGSGGTVDHNVSGSGGAPFAGGSGPAGNASGCSCHVSSRTDGGATMALLLLAAIGSGRRKKPRAKRATPVREL
jgi:hypothetical protein